MATIVTRAGKGSPLTHNEVDANFTNLNTGKAELASPALTGNVTVASNSTTAAVTITQIGAGNALVVEDSASPDASPFVVTATGNVGIGTSSPSAPLNVAAFGVSNVPMASNAVVRIEQNPFGASETILQIAARDQSGGGAAIYFGVGAMANSSRITSLGATDGFIIQENSGGPVVIYVGGERVRVAANGAIGIGGANYGTSGQALISGGSGAAPAWGTLPLSGGGTGATTGAGAFANLMGYTSTATSGGATNLSNTSTQYQLFTGTSGQTVRLPNTSTLTTGWTFHIVNNSTIAIDVNSSPPTSLISIPAQTTMMVTCISTSGTGWTDWEYGFTDFGSVTGTGSVVLSNAPSLTGNLSFNSGYGSSAVAYGCRAWVNFNGTGTVAIRASGNVTSITDGGTGVFTVNFTTAMPDANYTLVGTCQGNSSALNIVSQAAGSANFTTRYATANTATDPTFVDVAVFR